jgi:hypothetical protein
MVAKVSRRNRRGKGEQKEQEHYGEQKEQERLR